MGKPLVKLERDAKPFNTSVDQPVARQGVYGGVGHWQGDILQLKGQLK